MGTPANRTSCLVTAAVAGLLAAGCGEDEHAWPQFTDVDAGLRGVSSCSLSWGDYDNDGGLDIALAGYWSDGDSHYEAKVYRNEVDSFADVPAGLAGVSDCSLAWGDYDNDGDLDLALAGHFWDGSDNSLTKVYRNDGGTLNDIGAAVTGVSLCSLAWGDYDNDGDLDLALIGDSSGGVFRNDGGGVFTDTGAQLTLVSPGHCSLAWGDADNDGDLDLAVAGEESDGHSFCRVFWNDAGVFLMDRSVELAAATDCSVDWGDYDNDGDLDLAVAGFGQGGWVSRLYRSDGARFNWRHSAPTGLATAIGSGEVTFSWNAALDPETPSPGLTYNLRVGTQPGRDDVVSGMSIIAGANDGKRLIPAMGNVQHNTSWTLALPPGTYYWSVQAIDTAFCGSPWAPE